MKKIIAGLFAAIMMAAGLVAFSGSASVAGPYEGEKLDTNTRIDAPDKVEQHTRARIGVKVTTAGNAEPKGQVTITVVRGKGGYEFTDSVKYTGDKVWFKTDKLDKRGNYIIKARFDRKPGSRFRDSDNRAEFQVTRNG